MIKLPSLVRTRRVLARGTSFLHHRSQVEPRRSAFSRSQARASLRASWHLRRGR
jgi:hypothetical protein